MRSLSRPPLNAIPVTVEADCMKLLFQLLDAENVIKVASSRSYLLIHNAPSSLCVPASMHSM